ncbi:MAG: hypothetical protein ABI140_11800, partial [Jatrophihabitantaceae bacterium]
LAPDTQLAYSQAAAAVAASFAQPPMSRPLQPGDGWFTTTPTPAVAAGSDAAPAPGLSGATGVVRSLHAGPPPAAQQERPSRPVEGPIGDRGTG